MYLYRKRTLYVLDCAHKSPRTCSKSIKKCIIFCEKAIQKRFHRCEFPLILNHGYIKPTTDSRRRTTESIRKLKDTFSATNPLCMWNVANFPNFIQNSNTNCSSHLFIRSIWCIEIGMCTGTIKTTLLSSLDCQIRLLKYTIRRIQFCLPFWEFNRIDSTFTFNISNWIEFP